MADQRERPTVTCADCGKAALERGGPDWATTHGKNLCRSCAEKYAAGDGVTDDTAAIRSGAPIRAGQHLVAGGAAPEARPQSQEVQEVIEARQALHFLFMQSRPADALNASQKIEAAFTALKRRGGESAEARPQPDAQAVYDRFKKRIDNYRNEDYDDDYSYAVDIMEDMLKAYGVLAAAGPQPDALEHELRELIQCWREQVRRWRTTNEGSDYIAAEDRDECAAQLGAILTAAGRAERPAPDDRLHCCGVKPGEPHAAHCGSNRSVADHYGSGWLAGREQPAPQAWQPIATAPKDGTLVLGVRIRRDTPDYSPNVIRFEDGQWTDGEYTFSPTHWMPLPLPPAGSGTP